MKKLIFLAAMATAMTPAFALDVGGSITVGQPGFYGHIEIGDFPRPPLIYPKPTIIRPPSGGVRPPIYMHVPPGHAKNWRKHCKKYSACGQPVYFVQDSWYNNEYVPRYKEKHGGGDHDNGKGKGKGGGEREDGDGGKGKHKNKN